MTADNRPVLGMILKGYPRISETFISNEIFLLEQLGFSIHLISMRHPRESFAHKSVKKIQAEVDYLPETLLLPLPKFLYHNILLAIKRPRVYHEAFKTAIRRFSRTHKPATFKHLLQAGYLVHRLLPRRNIIHLHAHFAHSPASVAMFAAQLSGLPFSFTAHAKDIYTSDPKQLAEKLRLARFAVTCTEYNRRYLNNLSIPGKTPIYRVYHGIDLDFFSMQAADIAPSAPFRILTIARLTRKKGLHTVLRAIRMLVDDGIPIEHTLIGDGEDRKTVLTLIKALKLEKTVQWIGTQPHDVVLDYYRRADLFVLGCEIAPNGDRDGIPNVILESMAMGVPVVTTEISAIPEVIEDNRTGLLVSPGNYEEMASAMNRLLTEASLRNTIIALAQEKVQHFNNQTLTYDLASIYRDMIPEFHEHLLLRTV